MGSYQFESIPKAGDPTSLIFKCANRYILIGSKVCDYYLFIIDLNIFYTSKKTRVLSDFSIKNFTRNAELMTED